MYGHHLRDDGHTADEIETPIWVKSSVTHLGETKIE